MRRAAIASVIMVLISAASAAAQTIFVVRHAERADSAAGAPAMMATDPDLSEQGRARAQSLAAMLKDANVQAIFTTQYKRTKQTAEPLAKALGVTATEVDARNMAALVQQVKGTRGNALVVGHSNSVPALLKELGFAAPEIPDTEYDNLFVVTLGDKPSMVRLRFK